MITATTAPFRWKISIALFEKTGTLTKTSGCTPGDFVKAFDEMQAREPDKHILHLAYSAVTTCSYPSAIIAADGR